MVQFLFKNTVKVLLPFSLLFCCVVVNASIIEYDLTTANASEAIGADALVVQNGVQPAGSGVFQSFVRIKNTPSSEVDGYNTTAAAGGSGSSPVLNTMSDDNFSHSITLGDVATIELDSDLYYAFLLDINESNNSSDKYLSLDEIQIFMGGTPDASFDTFTNTVLNHDGALVWDLDAAAGGGDGGSILLNYDLEPGSGRSDMVLYLHSGVFDGFGDETNLVLYSRFGEIGEVGDRNYSNSDGYEEWASIAGEVFECTTLECFCAENPTHPDCGGPPPGGIPEPSTLLILASGLIGLSLIRRRKV